MKDRKSGYFKIDVNNLTQAAKIEEVLKKLEVKKEENDEELTCLGLENFDVKESNSGVVIMVTTKLRQNEFLGRVLNVCCSAKVLPLPAK